MTSRWVLYGAVVVCGAWAGACATKVGGTSSASGSTTSGQSTTGSSAGGSGASTTSSGAPTSSGAGGEEACSKVGTLHPPKMGESKTIYCPFSNPNGPPFYCEKQKEHCCGGPPPNGKGECKPIATQCGMFDMDWQCQDPSDCPMGEQCCSNDGAMFVKSPDPAKCANYASGMKGTHCAKSCLATEITMCTSDDQCAGKKCTPFSKRAAQVGACQ